MNKFIKKYSKLVNFSLSIILFIILVLPVFAGGYIKPDVFDDNQEGSFTGQAGYETADQYTLARIIGVVIQAFLSLLGIIFVVLMIYAGYNWMMAQGEEDKVVKAKDTLKRAVIGLVITIGAYAISTWVIYMLKFNY